MNSNNNQDDQDDQEKGIQSDQFDDEDDDEDNDHKSIFGGHLLKDARKSYKYTKKSVRSIHPYWSVVCIGKESKLLKKVSKHAYGVG